MIFLPKIVYAAINLTTRGPLYTCRVLCKISSHCLTQAQEWINQINIRRGQNNPSPLDPQWRATGTLSDTPKCWKVDTIHPAFDSNSRSWSYFPGTSDEVDRKEEIHAIYLTLESHIAALQEHWRIWMTPPKGIGPDLQAMLTQPAFFQLLASQPRSLGCNRAHLPRDFCAIFSVIERLKRASTETTKIFCLNEYHLPDKELEAFGQKVKEAQAKILNETASSSSSQPVEFVINVYCNEDANGIAGDTNYASPTSVKGTPGKNAKKRKIRWKPPRQLRSMPDEWLNPFIFENTYASRFDKDGVAVLQHFYPAERVPTSQFPGTAFNGTLPRD